MSIAEPRDPGEGIGGIGEAPDAVVILQVSDYLRDFRKVKRGPWC
jgi:hypothetical protein